VELVLTCTRAIDIWDKLCARFERSSKQRLYMFIESFFQLPRDCKEDVSMHVAKLQKLSTQTTNWRSTVKIRCLKLC